MCTCRQSHLPFSHSNTTVWANRFGLAVMPARIQASEHDRSSRLRAWSRRAAINTPLLRSSMTPASSPSHLPANTLLSRVGLAHSGEMMSRPSRSLVAILFVAAFASAATSGRPSPPLPNRADSLKFAAIGDNGTGDRPQFRSCAADGCGFAETFPFELVIMLGTTS